MSENLNEGEVNVANVIKSLGDTDWGENNEAQMKAVQLLKGLALSEDPKSNEFMKALSSASTAIAKKVVAESEEEEDEEKVDSKKVEAKEENKDKLEESMVHLRDTASKYL